MIRLNASPDMHYGVTLSKGVSKMGAREAIIKNRDRSGKVGYCRRGWTVPGKHKISRHPRAELLHAEYQAQLEIIECRVRSSI